MTESNASSADASPSAPAPNDASIRETLESIIIAFVLAFMFRAFIVEAFVIPTGSMAPTLLGAHWRADCQMCGYRFTVNASESDDRRSGTVSCNMCAYDINLPIIASVGPESGDRILVLKYIYEFSEPRRWDVVVFKNPEDPDQNYIKRLVGLPAEELWIVRGNVFTRPLASDGHSTGDVEAWRIQRKPYDVQEAVWVPVYHSRHFPLDHGEANVRGPVDNYVARRSRWENPWQPRDAEDGWSFNPQGARWHYDGENEGSLAFVFDEDSRRNYYHYNALAGPRGNNVAEDFRVGATFVPEEGGLEVTLNLSNQHHRFRGRVDGEGGVTLAVRSARDDAEAWRTVVEAEGASLTAGRGTRVEMWHADQRLSLWVAGRLVAEWEYEEDPHALAEFEGEVLDPVVTVDVAGGGVVLHDVNLDRDLYYTSGNSAWSRGVADPTIISADHFYCLGDNSPFSKDSRLWDDVDPWLVDMTDVPVGYVPREMMIGRAFFVYFPAGWRLREGGPAFIPNFADMRFIR